MQTKRLEQGASRALESTQSGGDDTASSREPLIPTRQTCPVSSTDWRSIYIVYYVMFVSEAARGLVLPSQWSYLAEKLQGTKTQLGVLVSIFSLGRMVATVPLGYMSDVWSARLVLALCCALAAVGSIGYALARSFTWLLLSRILAGVGSATVSVCRAHIARATSTDERTAQFANLSAIQFIGFAVLPIAGTAFSSLPRKSFQRIIFDEYRYPAWVLVLLNVSVIGILMMYYRDPPPVHLRESQASSDASQASDIESWTHRDAAAGSAPTEAQTMYADAVPTMTTTTVSKTEAVTDGATSSQYAPNSSARENVAADTVKDAFGERKPPTLVYRQAEPSHLGSRIAAQVDYPLLITCLLVNICFRGVIAIVETVVAPDLIGGEGLSLGMTSLDIGILGVLGLAAYLLLRPLSRRTGDYPLVVGGLALMTLGAFLLMMQSGYALPLWIYLTALSTIWSFGFPIGQTATLSIFSKVLADLPAGGFLGIFSAAGSLARLVFATLAGLLDERAGAGAPFVLAWLVCGTCLALAVLHRHKFIVATYGNRT